MPFDVIGGDFAKGFGSISGNSLRLPTGRGGWSSESISTAMIRSVEEVSQQTTHHKAHRLSKGLAGAALLGPLGLAFGVLAEGKTSTRVSFVVDLSDGRSFLGTSDHKTFLKIKAASLSSKTRNVAAALDELLDADYRETSPTKQQSALPTASSRPAALLPRRIANQPSAPQQDIESLLSELGWDSKQGILTSSGFRIFLAQRDHSKIMIAYIDEPMTHDKIDDLVQYRSIYASYDPIIVTPYDPAHLMAYAVEAGFLVSSTEELPSLLQI